MLQDNIQIVTEWITNDVSSTKIRYHTFCFMELNLTVCWLFIYCHVSVFEYVLGLAVDNVFVLFMKLANLFNNVKTNPCSFMPFSTHKCISVRALWNIWLQVNGLMCMILLDWIVKLERAVVCQSKGCEF